MAPEPTYLFYRDEHRGRLGEDAFADALPEARARLIALTGEDIPGRCEQGWLHACCALADHIGSPGGAHKGISSERVGGTAFSYTDRAALESDLAVVGPWLAGTGLLYAGLCRMGRRA